MKIHLAAVDDSGKFVGAVVCDAGGPFDNVRNIAELVRLPEFKTLMEHLIEKGASSKGETLH